jgi:hypothetical protein
MRVALAVFLLVHGFAHLVGFLGTWRLSAQVPYKTTILGGRLDLGDRGIRVMGLLWLLAALAFGVAAAATIAHPGWWLSFALLVSLGSLLMCLTAWPEAKIGAGIDALLIPLLAFGATAGW